MDPNVRILMEKPEVLAEWREQNKALFAPPVCNKLMHNSQLCVMFVGGPNSRRDFHLTRGSEFFFQIKGQMKLPIIEGGLNSPKKRRLEVMTINEGEVFIIPSCCPHAPQRPVQDGFGMVIERQRIRHQSSPTCAEVAKNASEGTVDRTEYDGIIYYEEFNNFPKPGEPNYDTNLDNKLPHSVYLNTKGEPMGLDTLLYKKSFYMGDLVKDMAPACKGFLASEECSTNKMGQQMKRELEEEDSSNKYGRYIDLSEDVTTDFWSQNNGYIPRPFKLMDFVQDNRTRGESVDYVNLFEHTNHPCKDMEVRVYYGGADKTVACEAYNNSFDDAHPKAKILNDKIKSGQTNALPIEYFIYQIQGSCEVRREKTYAGGETRSETVVIPEDGCFVLHRPTESAFVSERVTMIRGKGSVGLSVANIPFNNQSFYGYGDSH